jgi:enamine deaminase RidA (YjgF/YER057c/UK114 family)
MINRANRGNRMRKTIVPPALKSVYEQWHFAPAVVANGFVFCSGIIGTSPDGETLGEDGLKGAEATLADADAPLAALMAVRDPEGQFATAFEALKAILAHAGCDLSDLVEITTYHVDIARHMDTFMKVRDRYLSEPWPAWTAIGVSELIVPGGLMEIRAVAVVRG